MPEESSSLGGSLDLLHLYLQDLSRLPAIRERSEFALLARRIQRGEMARAYSAECEQTDEQQVIRSILEAAGRVFSPSTSHSARLASFADFANFINLAAEIDRFYTEVRPGDDARIRSAAGPAPDADDAEWDQRMEEAWQAFHALSLVPVGAETQLPVAGNCENKAFATRLREIEAEGAEARRRLIEGALRWPIKVARRYLGKGVPYLDLVQEGSFGLNDACDKFREWKGTHFQSYALQWIRQRITRYIADHARLVRVPVHVIDKIQVDAAEREAWADRHGALPSSLQFALHKGLLTADELRTLALSVRLRDLQARCASFERLRSSVDRRTEREHLLPEQFEIREALAQIHKAGEPPPTSRELMRHMGWLSDAEIEFLCTAETPDTMARYQTAEKAWEQFAKWRDRDQIVNGCPLSIERTELCAPNGRRYKLRTCLVGANRDLQRSAFLSSLRDSIQNVLATLSPREEQVLRMRFGLDHEGGSTLEEIGEVLGVTRERVRQIEAKALRRLRRPLLAHKLRDFYSASTAPLWNESPLHASAFAEALDWAESLHHLQAGDDLSEERAEIDALLRKYKVAPRKSASVHRGNGRAEAPRGPGESDQADAADELLDGFAWVNIPNNARGYSMKALQLSFEFSS